MRPQFLVIIATDARHGVISTSAARSTLYTHLHEVIEDSERHHDDEKDGRAVGDDDERRDAGGERAEPDAQRQRDVHVHRVNVLREPAHANATTSRSATRSMAYLSLTDDST